MNATGKPVSRLLPLFVILAVLPFSILSCTKAGDEPDGPTGPASQYNPELDTPGAKIAVSTPGTGTPGVKFALSAAFTDGDGRPVQGVPLTTKAETGTGNVVGYFTYEANPNITDEQGRISTHITPSADCPNGSYTFVVSSAPGGVGPVNGPYARGFGGVYVGGSGIAAVTSVTLTTPTPTVELVGGTGTALFQVVAVKTPSCNLQITYQSTGAGASDPAGTPGSALFPVTVTAQGPLGVIATGSCLGDPATVSSDLVTVTVTDTTPG